MTVSNIIQPDWCLSTGRGASDNPVRALCSTRQGGRSSGAWDSNNLALHVDDNEAVVLGNRRHFFQEHQIPEQVQWLNQIHGTNVVEASSATVDAVPNADACWTTETDVVCCVMTADCLPVLFADEAGTVVAAAHAGWRGLAQGVLQQTLDAILPHANGQIHAWIGPAISQPYFQVGNDVKTAFTALNADLSRFFAPDKSVPGQGEPKWLCDLPAIAQFILSQGGVSTHQSKRCSFAESSDFYSYRRDGQTGRMASMIWLPS